MHGAPNSSVPRARVPNAGPPDPRIEGEEEEDKIRESPFLRLGKAWSRSPCPLTGSWRLFLCEPLPPRPGPTPQAGPSFSWLWLETGDLVLSIGDFTPSFSHTFESFKHFCLTQYRPTFYKNYQATAV